MKNGSTSASEVAAPVAIAIQYAADCQSRRVAARTSVRVADHQPGEDAVVGAGQRLRREREPERDAAPEDLPPKGGSDRSSYP